MKRRNLASVTTIAGLIAILGMCGIVWASPAWIRIESISYDKESKKVKLVYDNGYRVVAATDSGPILLCAINRLLKQKYAFDLVLKEGQTISRVDLATFYQAAHLLTENGSQTLRNSVLTYIQNGSIENGNKVFNSLVDGMYERLKDHATAFEAVWEDESAATSDLKEKLGKLDLKIETLLDGQSASVLDEDERKIVSKFEKQRSDLQKQIADAKPEKKVESGSQSPVDWSICLGSEGSRSQSHLSNKNIDELLSSAKSAVNELAPAAPRNRGSTDRNHSDEPQ